MKRLHIIIASLLLSSSVRLYAQQRWAMAFSGEEDVVPTIMEYHSVEEKAKNGVTYYRIIDDSYLFRKEAYNPVKLQYGYRFADNQMFIYDFEIQEETLAFDFNLSKGDHFTTFNGEEWEVVTVKDTLVNISLCGNGEPTSKKLLTVKAEDGTMTDQWLEDFGSLSNHFMISNLEDGTRSQTLWVEYGMGEYLAREITLDPIFAHDTGWLDGTYDNEENEPYTSCTYKNGQLVFEDVQMSYAHRTYSCFYRDGDNICRVYVWEMNPHIDNGTLALRQDVITFKELPNPASGKYGIHIDGEIYTTRISNVCSVSKSADSKYDLLGRMLKREPSKGIYIRGGKKVCAK